MALIEIERKFLVRDTSFKKEAYRCERIVQGYLASMPECTVRIRIKGDKAFITIKGKSDNGGISRFEWEKEIDVADANQLLNLCQPGMIDKYRYNVSAGSKTFEVDEFCGENEGLIIAEIELESENEPFLKPSWLGKEVTGDNRYYNSSLSKNPYKNW